MKFLVGQLADGVVFRVVVDVREEYGLREWRADVFARATIAVSACTNLANAHEYDTELSEDAVTYLVVERTVNTVLLRTEDVCLVGSQ